MQEAALPTLDPAVRPRIAEVLKALGHPLRLQIVELLTRGESCVSTLQRATGASQSTVSQQMTILRHAAVVEVRKEGTRHYYGLANPKLIDLLRCLAACQAHCTSA